MSAEGTVSHPTGRRSGRWLTFGVATALYAGFGVAIGSVAPFIAPISQDLRISAGEMGAILGAWQIVYLGTSYFVGLGLDRFGMRRTIAAGMLVIAASLAFRGLAQDFGTFLASVALFGVGGPVLSIGMPKLVATLFGERERATPLGIGIAAPFAGQVIVFGLSNSVLLPLAGSWRGVMFIYGAAVVALTLVWWRVGPREAAGASRRASAGGPAGERARLLDLLRLRNVAIAVSGAAMLFAIGHGGNNWIARMLQTHAYDAVGAGYWAAFSNSLSALGVVTIPRLVPAGRRRFVLAGLVATLSAGVLGLAVLDGLPLVLAVLAFGSARTAPMALLFLVLIDTPGVGGRYIGTVGGAYYAIAEVGGFAGPFVIGLLLDHSGSFVPGVGVLAALGLLLAVMVAFLQEPRPAR
ncbi:MAG: MFS transporter [Chloroflexi bacterium]|nr:MFS transporter [Chloroflexota bacterium]